MTLFAARLQLLDNLARLWPEMRHEIVLAPEAHTDFKRLSARDRATVADALEIHLRHEPTKTSRSRIKQLRGIRKPAYRLRIRELRVFYDVNENRVEILAIVPKGDAASWLRTRRT